MPTEIQDRFIALQEFIPAARDNLDDNAWGYIIGAAETETSARRNRLAIEKLALRPRVLNDVTEVACSALMFGQPARLPVVLGPVGGLESFDPRGAISVAEGAGKFGVPMMLSSVSKCAYDDVCVAAGNGEVIFQLYARETPDAIDAQLDRIAASGANAYCITVDSAVYSRRERDLVARYNKPWRATGEGNAAHYQASLNWKDIARLRARFDGNLILKGIATAEDAAIALDHGVDTIYVSNHGGRQLDHVAGTFDMLVEIAPVVRETNPLASIIVDGAVCRGTDIAKAIALGADGVGVGRMMCLALAAAGPEGIVRMLELLETELAATLALLGVCSLGELNATHVQLGDALPFGHSLEAAFPLVAKEIRIMTNG